MVNNLMPVTLVYAGLQEQQLIALTLIEGSTIADAIKHSNILMLYPEIDLSHQKVGIFGKVKSLETLLQANDRVEIYRPLRIDPKEIRRLKAKKLTNNNIL